MFFSLAPPVNPYNKRMRSPRSWLAPCYLALAGVLFLLLPWSQWWQGLAWSLPWPWCRLLAHPAARGAISGFGLLHIILAFAWPQQGGKS